MREDVKQRAAQIKLLIFDVDGVLTDGSMLFTEEGKLYKAFYAQDGLGMMMLQRTGVTIAVISGGDPSAAVERRMNHLGIKYIFQGHQKKLPVYQKLCEELSLTANQTAYVGDDLNDIPVLKVAGLGVAVANAHPLLQQYAHWQTERTGGRGAAREVCELIMQAQGTWTTQQAHYTEMQC